MSLTASANSNTIATTTAGWEFFTASGSVTNVLAPWNETAFDYKTEGQQFSFGEKFKGEDYIKVDKGSPTKARYAVFYAVKTDPVIFCRTRRDMIKAVKGLLMRPEVDRKSIRIFGLMGGAKKVVK